ncbi:hypothetical protein [Pseudoclavibacter terrae]|uniref:Uncharacterized protein n=1 Tax=Pseudoclavibacter terrae TaxID=1530195 RepID=A0A7J5B6T8_9MICO|nr:hypothetical protein [Pseudoclavibacter terrae]KAB1639862.1 hypothetical protein F8O03_06015 [Pseudoclavibacter terrae]
MVLMIGPDNEVLNIPAGGEHALRALGWEAQEAPHAEPLNVPDIPIATPEQPTGTPTDGGGGPPIVPAAEPGEEPKASASRGDWARYAEQRGIEPGELTKAELIAKIAELPKE